LNSTRSPIVEGVAEVGGIPSLSLRPWSLGALTAAAISLSAQATAQVSATGSASIVEPNGVNLLQGQPAHRSAALGEVTFVLNTQINGTLTLQLPGFVAQSSEGGRALLLGQEGGQSVTGTTMTSETLSLSVGARVETAGVHGGGKSAPNVTLLLAQYN
jgi:hypothetical protein